MKKKDKEILIRADTLLNEVRQVIDSYRKKIAECLEYDIPSIDIMGLMDNLYDDISGGSGKDIGDDLGILVDSLKEYLEIK